MDNRICKNHNEPALFCEQDNKQSFVLLCRFCIQQRYKIQNIEEVDNQQRQALQQLELKYEKNIKLLIEFAEKLEQYIQQIQQKLKKFKLQVEQNISNLIAKKNEFKNQSNNFKSLKLINEQESIVNNQFTQVKQLLNNQLKELEISNQLDQLYQSFNNLSIDFNKKENEQLQVQQKKQSNQKFDYQLMKQSYKQNDQCFAITFNKDSTIMFAGCDKLIKVFQFRDEILKEVQQLNGHSKGIFCLHFMKYSNQLISGSLDTTMIIWEYNINNQQWLSNQVLKDHSNNITCITTNLYEDLLISGSYDKTIKFWQKKNNYWKFWQIQNYPWIYKQSIDCLSSVYSISLHDQENKLIASVENKQILVIQLQGNEWMIHQKIQVGEFGYRLCYINQDQFVFQPYDRQYLQIYDYDAKDQTFKKGQELQYSNKPPDSYSLFPIRYVSKIRLIIVKNDYHIHLISKSQNGLFIVEQSINFGTNLLFGGITDDGRYIATWDYIQKEIQIRKLQN